MKRKLLLAFTLTLLGLVSIQSCKKTVKSPWKKVFHLPISGSSAAPITKIQCISNSVCYILAKEGFIRSTNGGRLWTDGDITNVITNGYNMNYFQFTNENKGICIANDNTNTKVFGTVNGGITWTMKAIIQGKVAHKLIMSDSANGIIQTMDNEYLSTANGGATWLYEGSLLFSFSNVAEITLYGSVITAMNFYGDIYQSINKGKTWLPKGVHPDGSSSSTITCTDAKTLYADGDGRIFKSTNSGKDWVRVVPEQGSTFHLITVYNGTSLGMLAFDAERNLYVFTSTDGGVSWRKDLLSDDGYYDQIDFDLVGATFGMATIGSKVYSLRP